MNLHKMLNTRVFISRRLSSTGKRLESKEGQFEGKMSMNLDFKIDETGKN